MSPKDGRAQIAEIVQVDKRRIQHKQPGRYKRRTRISRVSLCRLGLSLSCCYPCCGLPHSASAHDFGPDLVASRHLHVGPAHELVGKLLRAEHVGMQRLHHCPRTSPLRGPFCSGAPGERALPFRGTSSPSALSAGGIILTATGLRPFAVRPARNRTAFQHHAEEREIHFLRGTVRTGETSAQNFCFLTRRS